MKKILLLLITITLISHSLIAQSNNLPVIALDKMNVLYHGIDNPITIGSSQDFSKVKVTAINGSITGELPHMTVRPTSIEMNTTIVVEDNGIKTNAEFRVKRIPDPSIFVGTYKGGRIPANLFKAQNFLRSQLENFNYIVDFKVESFVVYLVGTGFEDNPQYRMVYSNRFADIADLVNKCKPGTGVLFDEVTVSGPDGIRKLEPTYFTLY
jgi:hypothetical protein